MSIQRPRQSEAELLQILQLEEFYHVLRSKEVSENDRIAINDFASKALTVGEWQNFVDHCVENQIDPYKEMREIIYSVYAKILRARAN